MMGRTQRKEKDVNKSRKSPGKAPKPGADTPGKDLSANPTQPAGAGEEDPEDDEDSGFCCANPAHHKR